MISGIDAEARVLVTGAAGFIGSRLCDRLVASGACVHGTSRSPREGEGGIAWHVGDLSDAGFARRVVDASTPTHVFHLASRVTGKQGIDELLPTYHANLTSTVNLLAAVAGSTPRVVAAGSLVEPAPGRERDVPSSPYAASKWAAGDYLRMAHALYGIPASVARIFMVYGPGQRDTAKLVPYTALCALRGEPPRCASGTRKVDWIHVDDVVDGMVALAEASSATGETVDLGTGVLTSIRDVVESIVSAAGSSAAAEFGARPDPDMEPVEVADVDRTERLVGWRPQIALAKGLRDTVAWYESHHPREHG